MSTVSSSSEPVIIIGASRSGTGLMVRLLATNGFFVGHDLSANHESWFFQRLNRWLFANAGAGLETPRSVDRLLRDRFARRACTSVVADVVRDWPGHGHPWCFKDPRSTWTLPIWLDVIPDAKVIVMLRHGVDCAYSLVARRQRVETRWTRTGFREAAHEHVASGLDQQRVVANLHATTLMEAFAQWALYVRRAQRHAVTLGPRALVVRYESLLYSPEREAATLSSFLGRDVSLTRVPLESERAFAHEGHPLLRRFAERPHARRELDRAGYGAHLQP